MYSIRDLMNVVKEAEQPMTMIKTALIANTQTGWYIKDVDVKQVVDTERFVVGTAKRAADKFGSEFWGHTTKDGRGTYTISYGEEDILVVLDPSSPFYKQFDPSMEGDYAPKGFIQYYDTHLNN